MINLMKNPQAHSDAMSSPDFGSSFFFPSAEAQTILRWLQHHSQEISQLRILFLPSESPDSILTARAASICLHRLQPLYPNITLDCSFEPLSVKVSSRKEFLSTISNLFSKLDNLIPDQNSQPQDEEVIICATGGFKSVAGFAMMYAQLHSLPCLYSFEEAFSDAYEVMSIPLGYAYSQMDEEINMLKAIHENARVDTSALPQWVKDSEHLAGALLDSYSRAREKPYGTGEYLFRELQKTSGGWSWSSYLQSLLVKNWSYLWLGDQIPETVEHSRRHSKRLMELAANLFRCAGDNMHSIGFTQDDPLPLALLIASIYLHDIGHTALSYPVLAKNDSPAQAEIFPLGLFPSAVRELHHLLTGEVLSKNPSGFFSLGSEDPHKRGVLENLVPLIAAHHRRYTVLKSGETAKAKKRIQDIGSLLFGQEKFAETLRPLQDRAEKFAEIMPVKKLLWVTALLRILDGCDVQADRVVSNEYLSYRNQRSNDEIRLLQAELMTCIHSLSHELAEKILALNLPENEHRIDDLCKEIYELVFTGLTELKSEKHTWRKVQEEELPRFMALSLANRLAFKTEQHLNFRKHQCVMFVLPVMNQKENTITINVFPNRDMRDYSPDSVDSIVKDIQKEYEAAKSVLEDFPKFTAKAAGE